MLYYKNRQANSILFRVNEGKPETAGIDMATKPAETILPSISTPLTHICPRYEHAAQLLGKRWTGLLLLALMDGPRRFCELTALVEGLSDRVLSDRLRELEVEGIVNRVVYPQVPVRVEYELTDKGYALKPVVDAMHIWAEHWIPLSPLEADSITSPAGEIENCSN